MKKKIRRIRAEINNGLQIIAAGMESMEPDALRAAYDQILSASQALGLVVREMEESDCTSEAAEAPQDEKDL